VYVYDGVPLYPGFSSDGATLLATLCGSNVDSALSVTSNSGVMTVFFEAVRHSSSGSVHSRTRVSALFLFCFLSVSSFHCTICLSVKLHLRHKQTNTKYRQSDNETNGQMPGIEFDAF